MTLEQQVTSLEISKKLKELGVKQESLFWWETRFDKSYLVWEDYHKDIRVIDTADVRPRSSAFTVAELGEMLPHALAVKGKFYYLTIPNGNGLKWIDYATYSEESGVATFLYGYPLMGGDTEADARGKMLIYLLENDLIK